MSGSSDHQRLSVGSLIASCSKCSKHDCVRNMIGIVNRVGIFFGAHPESTVKKLKDLWLLTPHHTARVNS